MKRSNAIHLIANQIDFINGTFEGSRSDFSEEELRHADVILTTLESAGMRPPKYNNKIPTYREDDGMTFKESNGTIRRTWEPED